jgi:hypothetical protein
MAQQVAEETKRETKIWAEGDGFDVANHTFYVFWNHRRERWEVTMTINGLNQYVSVDGEDELALCCICGLVEKFWN